MIYTSTSIHYILKDMTKDTGSTRIHHKLGFWERKKAEVYKYMTKAAHISGFYILVLHAYDPVIRLGLCEIWIKKIQLHSFFPLN